MTTASLLELATFASESTDGKETGGIVLGTDPGLGGDLTVHHCGDAGPRAIRLPTKFRRDVQHAQNLANKAREAGGSAWIGEWHTHLLDLPMPSTADLKTYTALLDDPTTQLTRLLALIVTADDDFGWQRPVVHAWTFTGSVLRQLPLVVEPNGQDS